MNKRTNFNAAEPQWKAEKKEKDGRWQPTEKTRTNKQTAGSVVRTDGQKGR